MSSFASATSPKFEWWLVESARFNALTKDWKTRCCEMLRSGHARHARLARHTPYSEADLHDTHHVPKRTCTTHTMFLSGLAPVSCATAAVAQHHCRLVTSTCHAMCECFKLHIWMGLVTERCQGRGGGKHWLRQSPQPYKLTFGAIYCPNPQRYTLNAHTQRNQGCEGRAGTIHTRAAPAVTRGETRGRDSINHVRQCGGSQAGWHGYKAVAAAQLTCLFRLSVPSPPLHPLASLSHSLAQALERMIRKVDRRVLA